MSNPFAELEVLLDDKLRKTGYFSRVERELSEALFSADSNDSTDNILSDVDAIVKRERG